MPRGRREGLKCPNTIGAGKSKPFYAGEVRHGIGIHHDFDYRRVENAVPARFQFGGQRLRICDGSRDKKAHQAVTKCGARARKLSASCAPAA